MMRAIVEASPEVRAMVVETVETCRLNNATRHLLSRLVEEWARYEVRQESVGSWNKVEPRVIRLDTPIPRGGQDASTTAEEDRQKAKQ